MDSQLAREMGMTVPTRGSALRADRRGAKEAAESLQPWMTTMGRGGTTGTRSGATDMGSLSQRSAKKFCEELYKWIRVMVSGALGYAREIWKEGARGGLIAGR